MDGVANPEQVDLMAQPVCPVVGEIGEDKCRNPHGPPGGKFPRTGSCRGVEDGGVSADCEDFGEEAAALVHDATADVGEGVPESIESQSPPTVPHHLEGNQGEKHRDGQDDQVHVRK